MYIRLSIFILFCAFLPACNALFGYASGDAQVGIIVDAETGEPIPDAFVIGKWSTRGYETTICFHLSMTKTDLSGKYHLPAWRKKSKFGSSNQTVVLHAYKSGYSESHPYLHNGDIRPWLRKIDVPPEKVEKRIAIIFEAARQIASCSSAGESERSVAHFYKALYEEASSFAGGSQFEDVLYLRRLAEEFELGYQVARNRYMASLRELKNKGVEKKEMRVQIIENVDQKIRGPN